MAIKIERHEFAPESGGDTPTPLVQATCTNCGGEWPLEKKEAADPIGHECRCPQCGHRWLGSGIHVPAGLAGAVAAMAGAISRSEGWTSPEGWDCYKPARNRADEVRRRRLLCLALAALEALDAHARDWWGSSVTELVREEGEIAGDDAALD